MKYVLRVMKVDTFEKRLCMSLSWCVCREVAACAAVLCVCSTSAVCERVAPQLGVAREFLSMWKSVFFSF